MNINNSLTIGLFLLIHTIPVEAQTPANIKLSSATDNRQFDLKTFCRYSLNLTASWRSDHGQGI